MQRSILVVILEYISILKAIEDENSEPCIWFLLHSKSSTQCSVIKVVCNQRGLEWFYGSNFIALRHCFKVLLQFFIVPRNFYLISRIYDLWNTTSTCFAGKRFRYVNI